MLSDFVVDFLLCNQCQGTFRFGSSSCIHASRVDTILALIMSHNEIILDMFYLQEKPNTEAPEEFENAALLLRQGLSPAN